jgi:hypothetical protein
MITFTVTLEVRDAIAIALVAHASDPRMAGALGRVKKADAPLTTAGIVRFWPADSDGRCRIALNCVAGTLVWRAMAIADCVAGRDITADLAGRLGVTVEDAFLYVLKCASKVGHRCDPYVESSQEPNGRQWTRAIKHILAGRQIGVPYDGMDNLPRFDNDKKRRNYASMDRAGLMLQPTLDDLGVYFRPRASSLFLTPVPNLVTMTFSVADDEAIAGLAT